jgi:hypothetical protein
VFINCRILPINNQPQPGPASLPHTVSTDRAAKQHPILTPIFHSQHTYTQYLQTEASDQTHLPRGRRFHRLAFTPALDVDEPPSNKHDLASHAHTRHICDRLRDGVAFAYIGRDPEQGYLGGGPLAFSSLWCCLSLAFLTSEAEITQVPSSLRYSTRRSLGSTQDTGEMFAVNSLGANRITSMRSSGDFDHVRGRYAMFVQTITFIVPSNPHGIVCAAYMVSIWSLTRRQYFSSCESSNFSKISSKQRQSIVTITYLGHEH